MILFGNWKTSIAEDSFYCRMLVWPHQSVQRSRPPTPAPPPSCKSPSTLMRNSPAPVWLSEKGTGWMELRMDPGVPSWRTPAADQESLRTEPFHRHWLHSSVFVVLVRHQKSIFSPSFGNPLQMQKPKSEFLP